MRVTDRMLFDSSNTYTQAARARMQDALAQTSTGLRVQTPGDDPEAAGQIVSNTMLQGQYAGVLKSSKAASSELSTADGALAGVNNALTRARELATQLANSTYSATDRAAGAAEIGGLIGTIVAQLNTKVGNRYLFGGTQDAAPPFDTTGAYHGDSSVRQVQIAPGVLQQGSVQADVAIKGAGGGVDVLATLKSLQASLSANDPAAVSVSIDQIAASITQVSQARAQAGTSINAFDTAASVSQSQVDAETKIISDLGSADLIAAATTLTQSQTALQAAISAAATSFKFTLVDKIQ